MVRLMEAVNDMMIRNGSMIHRFMGSSGVAAAAQDIKSLVDMIDGWGVIHGEALLAISVGLVSRSEQEALMELLYNQVELPVN